MMPVPKALTAISAASRARLPSSNSFACLHISLPLAARSSHLFTWALVFLGSKASSSSAAKSTLSQFILTTCAS